MLALAAREILIRLRAPGFLVWSALAAVLFVAGVALDVLALEPAPRRILEVGGSAMAMVSWTCAIAVMLGAPTGAPGDDGHAESLAAAAPGAPGLILAQWLASITVATAASMPTAALVIVLYTKIQGYDCIRHLLIIASGVVAGSALLSAWVGLVAPNAGRAAGVLAVLALWWAGPSVLPGPLRALAPPVVGPTAGSLLPALSAALAAVGVAALSLAAAGVRVRRVARGRIPA